MRVRLLIIIALFALFGGVIQAQLPPNPDGIITSANADEVTLFAERQIPGAFEVRWSTGGTRLAVSSGTNVLIYAVNDLLAEPISLEHPEPVIDMAFNPDGRVLATAALDGAIRFWLVSTGQLRSSRTATNALTLAYSPDGSLIAYTTGNDNLRLWNVLTDEITILDDTGLGRVGVAFNADGTLIASSHDIGVVSIWQLGVGEIARYDAPREGNIGGGESFDPTQRTLNAVDFSVDGVLVTGNTRTPRSAHIWDSDQQLLGEIGGLNPPIEGIKTLEFGADGSLIASAGGVSNVVLWGLNGEPLNYLPHEEVQSVDFSPDGTTLASAGGNWVRLWRTPQGALTQAQGRALSDETLLAYCENFGATVDTLPHNTEVGLVWSWYATTRDLLDDHLRNAFYIIRLNDRLQNNWRFVTAPTRDVANNDDWTIYYYQPLGRILPGEQIVTYEVRWDEPISDGYADYGPDTERETDNGRCVFRINTN